MYLEKINEPGDVKKLNKKELELLCGEIREFLIEKISQNGGHLASNLGVVELTIALHLALDLPGDKIIWDVGHQSYTHKLLTGRREGFDTLRKYGGMSDFQKEKKASAMYLILDTVLPLFPQVLDMSGPGSFWERITKWFRLSETAL